MNFHRLGLFRIVASLTLMAATAGATFGLLSLAGVTLGLGEPSKSEPGGRLLTAERDRLAICVQSVNIDESREPVQGSTDLQVTAESQIEGLLPQLAAHPAWIAQGFSSPTPTVDAGCPAMPAVYEHMKRSGTEGVPLGLPGRLVSNASYYRVFVFIFPQDEAERISAWQPVSVTSEEVLRIGGDAFDTVTTGLYLSAEDLKDSEQVMSALRRAIGLDRP